MVILKTDGEMISQVVIVNVVRGKFEVWTKNAVEPVCLDIKDVQCIS